MIAVDTNVLVHAHRAESPFHVQAKTTLRALAEGYAAWAIPWPCVHEFYAKVTHPRIFRPPSSVEQALAQIEAWLKSPSIVLLAENSDHFRHLARLTRNAHVEGPMVHDARIAALCLSHGVTELLSADRDFGRFPDLRTRNPLV
jgi:toxin-antitoxin system PIN domain toxin